MWRRTYLCLVLVRLYFALCPSYLHPDEHFQGPEVVAGRVFSYPVHETWEFTSSNPIRSAFPLWPVYGLPMLLLRWLWEDSGYGIVRPYLVFWTLRFLMFVLSFVLEDWAIHELIDSPRDRRIATMLIASSYVTWSWQVHTFSNSIETLVVLWSLVLIKRLRRDLGPYKSGWLGASNLAGLMVFGVFTRITFPAFVFLPALSLIPRFMRRPSLAICFIVTACFTTFLAVAIDTAFYQDDILRFSDLLQRPVLTPLNSLLYNSQTSNLALHGTHPFYQHFAINLPQLLGPAFLLLFVAPRANVLLLSAMSGIAVLSVFPHQEARFLLPAVPLCLGAVKLPTWKPRLLIGIWIAFNVLLGLLMGVFHQAGVVPAQMHLEALHITTQTQAYWWKTYSPPTWLLDGYIDRIETIDLMGLDKSLLEARVCSAAPPNEQSRKLLVAPKSATFLDRFSQSHVHNPESMELEHMWSTSFHLNLDDMDFGDDGFLPTLQRVIGRRGLTIWRVTCP